MSTTSTTNPTEAELIDAIMTASLNKPTETFSIELNPTDHPNYRYVTITATQDSYAQVYDIFEKDGDLTLIEALAQYAGLPHFIGAEVIYYSPSDGIKISYSIYCTETRKLLPAKTVKAKKYTYEADMTEAQKRALRRKARREAKKAAQE